MQTVNESSFSDESRNKQQPWRLLVLVFFSCGLLIGLGCRSTKPAGPPAYAAVRIADTTPGQISYATVQVFRENGYLVAHGGLTNLVFERQASGVNNFAYGNWVGDTPVWERVKAGILPLGETAFQLQCDACMVRDKGGSTEEEIRLGKLHHSHYQKLLEQVAQRFKPPSDAAKLNR